jgi:hypothetical protein
MICSRRKPPRPSASPPWQGGEFKMKGLIIKPAIAGGGLVDMKFSILNYGFFCQFVDL